MAVEELYGSAFDPERKICQVICIKVLTLLFRCFVTEAGLACGGAFRPRFSGESL